MNEEIYQIGQCFKLVWKCGQNGVHEYRSFVLLSRITAKTFALIDLSNGNRFQDPIEVKYDGGISYSSVIELLGSFAPPISLKPLPNIYKELQCTDTL